MAADPSQSAADLRWLSLIERLLTLEIGAARCYSGPEHFILSGMTRTPIFASPASVLYEQRAPDGNDQRGWTESCRMSDCLAE